MSYTQWFRNKFKTWSYDKEDHYEQILTSLIKRKGNNFVPKYDEPCFRCKGKGGYNVACGPYDSDWETCDRCKGSGVILKSVYKTWYNDYKEDEKARKLKEDIILKELKRIKAKITKKELEFLLKHSK
jgi:hypothetical protein